MPFPDGKEKARMTQHPSIWKVSDKSETIVKPFSYVPVISTIGGNQNGRNEMWAQDLEGDCEVPQNVDSAFGGKQWRDTEGAEILESDLTRLPLCTCPCEQMRACKDEGFLTGDGMFGVSRLRRKE